MARLQERPRSGRRREAGLGRSRRCPLAMRRRRASVCTAPHPAPLRQTELGRNRSTQCPSGPKSSGSLGPRSLVGSIRTRRRARLSRPSLQALELLLARRCRRWQLNKIQGQRSIPMTINHGGQGNGRYCNKSANSRCSNGYDVGGTGQQDDHPILSTGIYVNRHKPTVRPPSLIVWA